MNLDAFSKSKARLKSRRGLLELDFVLQRFIEHDFDYLTLDEKKLFFQLLEWEDPVLYACLIEAKISPEHIVFKAVIEKIRVAHCILK